VQDAAGRSPAELGPAPAYGPCQDGANPQFLFSGKRWGGGIASRPIFLQGLTFTVEDDYPAVPDNNVLVLVLVLIRAWFFPFHYAPCAIKPHIDPARLPR
jgi:hypothetical protein